MFTDGACSGNPGPGGWAWVVPDGPFAAGFEARSTNQRMEIKAAYEAVRATTGPVEVVSDSTYVVNCFRDRWWEGWLERGWKNSSRKPVANRDLWEPFIDLVRTRGDVTFRWVKGHANNRWNDLADRLAVEAGQRQQERSGDHPPTEVGPADEPGGSASDKKKAGPSYTDGFDGHTLVVLGHKPTELGGYDPNPTADAVRHRLADIIAAKRHLHPDLLVVSGLRLGAEQLGAEAAREVGVPYAALLPFPEPDAPWPKARRAHFADLVADARDTLTLEKKTPDTTAKVAAALRRRDAWMAQHLDEAVLVWDGRDKALEKLHKSLTDRMGDEVWVVDPTELTTGGRRR